MRHFISYGADGSLVGVHSHKFAQGGIGGWPEGFDLENGREAVNDDARDWANRFLARYPDRVEGFVLYECPCPPTTPGGSCRCPNLRRTDHMMNGDKTALVQKPASAVVIDDAVWDGVSEVQRDPLTEINVKITCAGAADGEKVTISRPVSPRLWPGDAVQELEFSSGETPVLVMTALPARFGRPKRISSEYEPMMRSASSAATWATLPLTHPTRPAT